MSIVKFVRARNNFGNGETKEIPSLTGGGAPTTATAGAVGCLYMDTDTGELYKCTSADADADSYIWEPLVVCDSTQNATGFSRALCVALYNLLMDAAYQSPGHEADKAALEELLTGSSGGGDSGDSGETVVYYTIEKTLTNVSISNGAASVAAGSAYSATLTAYEGYTLGEVTVTMGGEAVTVTDGVIDIASVTGNIVITATATVEEADDGIEMSWTSGTAYDFTDATTETMFYCFDADYLFVGTNGPSFTWYDVNKNNIGSTYLASNVHFAEVPEDAVFFTTNNLTVTVTPITKADSNYTPGVQNVTWTSGYTDIIPVSGAQYLICGNAAQMRGVTLYDAHQNEIATLASKNTPLKLNDVFYYKPFSFMKLRAWSSGTVALCDDTVKYIKQTLTGVTNSNTANCVTVGEAYTNTFAVSDGYTLDGATVTVKMGGTDITESAYADGVVTIDNVTDYLEITVTAVTV